jgi:hypothetical protein
MISYRDSESRRPPPRPPWWRTVTPSPTTPIGPQALRGHSLAGWAQALALAAGTVTRGHRDPASRTQWRTVTARRPPGATDSVYHGDRGTALPRAGPAMPLSH